MSLVDRAKNIIVSPKNEWAVIAEESPDVGSIITTYVLPLAVVASIAAFIGYGIIGVPIPFFGGTSASITVGISQAVLNLILSVISVLLTAFVVDALAGSFASEKNFGRAVQLVAYSYTPMWLGGIFNVYPPLGVIGSLFGLYGFYLIYLGLPHTMKTPKDKVVIYLIVTILVLLVIYFIIAAILTAILAVVGLGLVSAAM
ncbi:MAG: YIP1 family protein [Ignavibacteriae bacterium]|nr:YIP1 family protein [Ignavibacteriota bacterium]